MTKKCGTCTKCCEGWLKANINGHDMYTGKPCYFLDKGCTIYKDRPDDPCKTFYCGWMKIHDMPDDFKPEKSGVIMHWQNPGYWMLTKAPNNPTLELLSWAIVYARSRNQNIIWYIDERSWWLGDEAFCKEMEALHV